MNPPAQRWTATGSAGPTIGRRSMLIMGVAGSLALTGCTSSGQQPSPSGSAAGTGTPAPTPTPLPGTVEAGATENELAQYAAAILAGFGKHLAAQDRHLITAIRDAHLAHVAALGSPDPVSVPAPSPTTGASSPTSGSSPTVTPEATTAGSGSATNSAGASGSALPTGTATGSPTAPTLPKSPAKAIKKLRALETKASAAHRKRALDPTGPQDQRGWLTLLWGSLATAADDYARALTAGRDPGAHPDQDHRVAVKLPDAATAVQNLVEQCYPIIFGYQAAIAGLSGSAADHARSSLAAHRALRDQLSKWLTEQKADVPNAHAAYDLPVQPTSPSRAAKLLGTMEDQLLPYLGQWLASSKDDQESGLTAMITGTRNVGYWTHKINIWPGWPVQR